MIVKSFKTYVKKICMVRMMEGGGGKRERERGRGKGVRAPCEPSTACLGGEWPCGDDGVV